MSRDYTEVIESKYPGYMKEQWQNYVKYLERELRKSLVKIAELEVRERRQKIEEEVKSDKLHTSQA